MDEIETYALSIESKHAMFVFDSAFSGSIFAVTRGVDSGGRRPASPPRRLEIVSETAIPDIILFAARRPVRLFITAGAADQPVPDRSVFREQFVEGLEGAADINRDGYITGSELGVFIQDRVTQYTRGVQTPQWGKIRNPNLDRGDFLFAVPNPPPASLRLRGRPL
jgi:hypothetical protein